MLLFSLDMLARKDISTNILQPSSTQDCSTKHRKLENEASLQQVKQTARASAPETAAFHGTELASSPAQEGVASLAAAARCEIRLAQQRTRGRGRALGRVRVTDNGDEVGAVALEGASGRRRTDGSARAMLFSCFVLLFFSFEVIEEGSRRYLLLLLAHFTKISFF